MHSYHGHPKVGIVYSYSELHCAVCVLHVLAVAYVYVTQIRLG